MSGQDDIAFGECHDMSQNIHLGQGNLYITYQRRRKSKAMVEHHIRPEKIAVLIQLHASNSGLVVNSHQMPDGWYNYMNTLSYLYSHGTYVIM